MKSVNLIPAPRRDAKRRRRHRTTCTAACGAYAAVLACAVGVARIVWGSAAVTEELDGRIATAEKDIQRLERQTADARVELATARATVEANRTVAGQPDWSVLLALLAKTIGDDVVLRTVSLAPPPNVAAAPAPGTPGASATAVNAMPDVVLDIGGIGRSQLAVSQHVLRLEQTGLFSKVTLLDTGREPYLNGNAIAFRLQCTFGDRPAQPAAPAVAAPAVTAAETGGISR
jgi:Tfp pilus assembly protein PilN